jgi:hypothetical protein
MSDRDTPDWLRPHLDGLARELPPRRDLWPGIVQGMQRTPRGRWMPLAVAASLTISLASAWFAWQVHVDRQQQALAVQALLAEIETPYRQARAEHVARWDALRTELDAETVAVIEQNVTIIQAATAELRRAIERSPQSAHTRDLLNRTLSQELALYRQASLLTLESVHGPQGI